MGHETDDKARLMEAARTLLAKGDAKFSIAALCAGAGVERAVFRDHFSGKAALMAALLEPQTVPDSPAEPDASISTPDAWLERRLRVFERALTALEAKAEATAREQARAIAALEERLAGQSVASVQPLAPAAPAPVEAEAAPETDLETAGEQAPRAPVPELPPLDAEPMHLPSRAEMADVLASARGKVRVAPEEEAPDNFRRLRWLAIGTLSLVALFLCIGLTLGDTARATQTVVVEDGIAHRQVARGLRRVIALADAGDARAQAQLAMAYLRGEGVDGDVKAAARWSRQAAQQGQPMAEYLLGALYGHGDGVAADPARAFHLYEAAAAKGNVKAMHNLAIAYAQGLGTEKNEARAADWFARAAAHGYVDSAFDLAVLYERGEGVSQDLAQALKWYAVAAFAGDRPAQERVAFLRTQMNPAQVRLAIDAAGSFSPLQALTAANSL